ncbi:MAG TPA: hydrogenase/urease nickel incorporation protein HypA [Sulfurovum sp.]|uniref:hydrogenase/urease nickel incorporation protein HypA n=1 Tax=Sulfurovum sp. TaxID=1969726 RepID=UPI002F94E803
MHEYSIVQALLAQCEEHAKANDAARITKVVTKIGKLSGVEPHLLETAFETFKEHSICHGAEFVMQLQDLKLYCNVCEQESEQSEVRYQCLHCHSTDVTVLDGEDMYLMSLEME